MEKVINHRSISHSSLLWKAHTHRPAPIIVETVACCCQADVIEIGDSTSSPFYLSNSKSLQLFNNTTFRKVNVGFQANH